MDIQVNPIQQLKADRSGFQYLPTLLVDNKVTGIEGIEAVATYAEAEKIAQHFADKLLADSKSGALSPLNDSTTTSNDILDNDRNVMILNLHQNTKKALETLKDLISHNAEFGSGFEDTPEAALQPANLQELVAITIEDGVVGFIHHYGEPELRQLAQKQGWDIVSLSVSDKTRQDMLAIERSLRTLKDEVMGNLSSAEVYRLYMVEEELKTIKFMA